MRTYNKTYSIITRLLVFLLIVAMILPCSVYASSAGLVDLSQPRASYYLSMYEAYVYSAGAGLMQVWFDAQGTGYMDELGALSIEIYECSTNSSNINDWTWKKTFTYDSTSGMLSYNDDYHSGHVDYYGTIGKWYKAYVCIWGGKDGGGDTRYFWTSAKKATLFPE